MCLGRQTTRISRYPSHFQTNIFDEIYSIDDEEIVSVRRMESDGETPKKNWMANDEIDDY
ncbi:hypothetical protein P3T76_007301 [Phytophthora citrophthora]|uniref:Uncharacterized protein n=1 Tax=Phytophthora citrophthora TaxID=4793 RepID=A0AAD9LLT1_9STRA|nr:hypothetical protein P3T76_007301 [Phytophthora citrophthora]